jgi:hypothetical protein
LACSLLRLLGIPGEAAMNLLLLSREPIVPLTWYRLANRPSMVGFAVTNTPIEVDRVPDSAPVTNANEPWPAMHVSPLTPQ